MPIRTKHSAMIHFSRDGLFHFALIMDFLLGWNECTKTGVSCQSSGWRKRKRQPDRSFLQLIYKGYRGSVQKATDGLLHPGYLVIK